GGTDEDHEFTIADVQVDALDDCSTVEAFLQIADLQISHVEGLPLFHRAEGQAAYKLFLADPAKDQDGRAGQGRDGGELGPEQALGTRVGGHQGGQWGGGGAGQVE